MMDEKYIAMIGNLSDGFECFGPFESFDAASLFADKSEHISWIATLKPEKESDDK